MAIKKTKEQLLEVNPKYARNVALWRLYMACFKGIDAIVKGNYIPQHEREPKEAYIRRMQDLYSFGYSKSVTSIFTYHLMSSPPTGRKLQDLQDNSDLWNMFFADCNLFGDSYDVVMGNLALNASILGHVGILVDKAPSTAVTVADQKRDGVYPYMATYHPPAILDWKFKRDKQTHRPVLTYLKLLEDNGDIRIFTEEEWAVFNMDDDTTTYVDPVTGGVTASAGQETTGPPIRTSSGTTGTQNQTGGKPAPGATAIPVAPPSGARETYIKAYDEGPNNLKEIPFVWLYNQQTNVQGIGDSDIAEISRIDISLTKNASQIEEIINYAAFPVMMKPRRDTDPTKVATSNQQDEHSIQAIVEFDPQYPESKPEWLTPEVQSAITSILDHMRNKVGEIYRSANIGGLAGTEISTTAKSGVALKAEFQILNSTLVSKAINLEKAENKILEYWLKWEKLWDTYKDKVNFGRSKNFDVEDVAADLENALTAKTVVMSNTFDALLQKKVAVQVLPSMSEEDSTVVNKEIDDYIKSAPLPGESTTEDIDTDAAGESGDIVESGMSEEEEG